MSSQSTEPFWLQARPKEVEEAYVDVKGDIAIIRTKSGGIAVVPVSEVCKLAFRFNLLLKNYECRGLESKT